ncbi:MAG: Rossmann-like and DUF2520 domain-containing protein [Thermovenabulum sp.]|uniref:Rossmann-like and DUF2520 domain-containing protein n=1 Tax=Thermovenabulum sp. TaxID=3100335 RepID=UPI003C79C303
MKIGFIGASRAGISLSLYFIQKGLNVEGFFNRTYENALKAARLTNTTAYKTLSDIIKNTDVIILSVADSAIEEVAKNLPQNLIKEKCIGHLSGALSSDAIKTNCKGKFSLHPIQTLIGHPTDVDKLNAAIFSYEGDEEGEKCAKRILDIMKNKYIRLKKEEKVQYHLAATLASNYLIGLLNFSYNLYKKIGFEDDVISQIIKSLSFASIENFLKDRLNSLTGPASRGDIETLKKHYQVLEGDKKQVFLELVRLASDIIFEKGDFDLHEKLKKFIESKGGI